MVGIVETNGFSKSVVRRTGANFDEMPYVSMPIGYTYPARLAAMAQLNGLPTAPADKAKILEIGCASGGNLIPLAARLPGASFIGIDISKAHVSAAKQRIASLGLTNIEIRQGDIASSSFSRGQFDYIICHGVFSWVPMPAQEAILRICRDSLSEQGLAAISYNVLPGWHQRRVVRDLCLFHTKSENTAAARVAKARQIIAQVAGRVTPDNPYGFLLRTEAERLKTLPSSYILGEFLAPENTPFTFQDFTNLACRFGLGYLSESDLASSYPETLITKASKDIRQLAGGDAIALQMYTDIFSGRTFRRSLLMRQSIVAGARPPLPERLRGLHISSYLRRSGAADADKFKDQHGRIFTAKDAGVQNILVRIGHVFPATLAIADLLNDANEARAKKLLADTLFELVLSGSASVSTLPFRSNKVDDERPRVWSLARAEASSRQPWVTTPLHAGVAVNKVLTIMLPLMDGSSTRSDLQAAVALALKAGQLDDAVTTPPVKDVSNADAFAADYVRRGLAYLAINGLLGADADPPVAGPKPAAPAALPTSEPGNHKETPRRPSSRRRRNGRKR